MNATQFDMSSSDQNNTVGLSPEEPAANPHVQVADFELAKRDEGGWLLHILSPRGMYWCHANFAEMIEDDCILTLSQANAFLRQARKNALKTQYTGPNGPTIF
jgi:hypothetical protein